MLYGTGYALRGGKRNYMKTDSPFKKPGLNLTNVFKYMMEAGYNPSYEYTHIEFDFEGNIALVECENGFASVRIFFSIEPEECDMFVEASNLTMVNTYSVKPVVLDDRENIVFSCEFFCNNIRDFRRFFPRALDCLSEGVSTHKEEMQKIFLAGRRGKKTIPDMEDIISGIGRKILS